MCYLSLKKSDGFVLKVTFVTHITFQNSEICSEKLTQNTMALFGFSLVLIHLLLGFGFLVYKLSPRKKQVIKEKSSLPNTLKNNKI